jgi:hypothetical protein
MNGEYARKTTPLKEFFNPLPSVFCIATDHIKFCLDSWGRARSMASFGSK